MRKFILGLFAFSLASFCIFTVEGTEAISAPATSEIQIVETDKSVLADNESSQTAEEQQAGCVDCGCKNRGKNKKSTLAVYIEGEQPLPGDEPRIQEYACEKCFGKHRHLLAANEEVTEDTNLVNQAKDEEQADKVA